MKSFLENRTNLSNSSDEGAISSGAGFKSLAGGSSSGGFEPTQAQSQPAEVVANPNDPDAPQVEFVRDGEKVSRIIVSFGEQKVEIDCQY